MKKTVFALTLSLAQIVKIDDDGEFLRLNDLLSVCVCTFIFKLIDGYFSALRQIKVKVRFAMDSKIGNYVLNCVMLLLLNMHT